MGSNLRAMMPWIGANKLVDRKMMLQARRHAAARRRRRHHQARQSASPGPTRPFSASLPSLPSSRGRGWVACSRTAGSAHLRHSLTPPTPSPSLEGRENVARRPAPRPRRTEPFRSPRRQAAGGILAIP
ncbi:hypothetical protein AB5I41_17030 [Sphingomonas sp. MMS24-JH45]